MDTPERIRIRAEEIERLAALVSYARDKERLRAEAAELRHAADLMEARPTVSPHTRLSWLDRARAWLAARF